MTHVTVTYKGGPSAMDTCIRALAKECHGKECGTGYAFKTNTRDLGFDFNLTSYAMTFVESVKELKRCRARWA